MADDGLWPDHAPPSPSPDEGFIDLVTGHPRSTGAESLFDRLLAVLPAGESSAVQALTLGAWRDHLRQVENTARRARADARRAGGQVSGADLRVRRAALGLSRRWLAQRLAVRPHTIRAWEDGDGGVTEAAWAAIDDAESAAAALIEACLDDLPVSFDPHAQDVVVLLTVYPSDALMHQAHPQLSRFTAAWHRAALARVRHHTTLPVSFRYPAS